LKGLIVSKDVETQEEHAYHFGGWWIPPELVLLYDQKKVTIKEMLLVAVINSLSDPSTGLGCFASNKYLGEKVRIKDTKQIQKMIARLRKLGVVRQVDLQFGRKRFLETAWKPAWKYPPTGVKNNPPD
jgi:hypothetical protein